MRIQVALTLPREAVSVPLARHTVSAALQRAGIESTCLSEVQVALTEACTNVFRHAQEGDTYEVVINVSEAYLTVDVIDSGTGFGQRVPVAELPDPAAESGRGTALMLAFTDHTSFDEVEGGGGSVVHLLKRLNWAADAPMLGQPEANGSR
ncbi:MAG TPA: ATP-binding protein [Nocardioidaceae bacterium]|nr:ATP-binding protein [Nocardioidaceae bacterium]